MGKNEGLYRKYRVERLDGKELKGGAVVLEWGDPNARAGIAAFAQAVREAGYEALSIDLERILGIYGGAELLAEGIEGDLSSEWRTTFPRDLLLSLRWAVGWIADELKDSSAFSHALGICTRDEYSELKNLRERVDAIAAVLEVAALEPGAKFVRSPDVDEEFKATPELDELVAAGLVRAGYDGLVNDDCACIVDNLMPCGEPGTSCLAGHKVDGCSDTCGEGCDWHIVAGRRPVEEGGK